MNRRTSLTAVAVGALLAGSAVAASTAMAATQYTVRSNVPKPQAACGNVGSLPQGAWLANKPCGYIVGTALAGSRWDNHKNSPAGFHYGRARTSGGANFCSWILPSSLEPSSAAPIADSCSPATEAAIVHRRTIGRDFDNEPHVGNGVSTIRIDASACTGYYNYFDDSSYRTGTLKDPVGYPLPSVGAYRYSTNDLQAAMVRVGTGDSVTWMFVARSCIDSQLAGKKLSNTND